MMEVRIGRQPIQVRLAGDTGAAIGAAAAAEAARDAIIAFPDSPFEPGSTDDAARIAIIGVTISDEDDTDSYFMNYEFSHFPGIPLYRVKLRLHSVNRGVEVARWDFQESVEPSTLYEDTIHLTARVNTAEVITDVGVTALVKIDWPNVPWSGSGAVTAYTNANATGLRRGLVQTPQETRLKRLAPATPILRLMTVGSGKDFPTLTGSGGALEYIEQGGFASPMTRSTYPSTHLGFPEAPLEVRVAQTAYTEQVVPFTSSAVDQSPLRIPHGMILHLPYRDTLIHMNTVGNTGPVVEMNNTGTIYGEGRLRQAQSGYVVHIDSVGGIIEDLVRDIQSVLRGITLEKTFNDTVPLVGLGIASGQDVLFDEVRFERPSNAAGGAHIAGHNSPGETRAGRIHIRNCTSLLPNSAASFLSMNKSNASPARHAIIIENSEVSRIQIDNTAGGDPGYIRKFPVGSITITGDMEP